MDVASAGDYDLIILDVMLPERNGWPGPRLLCIGPALVRRACEELWNERRPEVADEEHRYTSGG